MRAYPGLRLRDILKKQNWYGSTLQKHSLVWRDEVSRLFWKIWIFAVIMQHIGEKFLNTRNAFLMTILYVVFCIWLRFYSLVFPYTYVNLRAEQKKPALFSSENPLLQS